MTTHFCGRRYTWHIDLLSSATVVFDNSNFPRPIFRCRRFTTRSTSPTVWYETARANNEQIFCFFFFHFCWLFMSLSFFLKERKVIRMVIVITRAILVWPVKKAIFFCKNFRVRSQVWYFKFLEIKTWVF